MFIFSMYEFCNWAQIKVRVFINRARSQVASAYERPKLKNADFSTMSPKKVFTADKTKEIGEVLGIDWTKFDVEQFRMGMDVELEHGTENSVTNVTNDDPLMTGKIALAHLNEFPDYYTRLLELEEEAEEYWERK